MDSFTRVAVAEAVPEAGPVPILLMAEIRKWRVSPGTKPEGACVVSVERVFAIRVVQLFPASLETSIL